MIYIAFGSNLQVSPWVQWVQEQSRLRIYCTVTETLVECSIAPEVAVTVTV